MYHYNHYEPTSVDHLTELHGTRQEAVGALMGRFATREDEVDDLFQAGVFTDLYRVVRQGVRAGVAETARIRSALLAGVSAETSGAIAWGVRKRPATSSSPSSAASRAAEPRPVLAAPKPGSRLRPARNPENHRVARGDSPESGWSV